MYNLESPLLFTWLEGILMFRWTTGSPRVGSTLNAKDLKTVLGSDRFGIKPTTQAFSLPILNRSVIPSSRRIGGEITQVLFTMRTHFLLHVSTIKPRSSEQGLYV